MFPDPVVFVDLETTGMTASDDRVTEVGIVRVECGHATEWSSLVNPDCSIPAAVQALTGISNAMVAAAPRFADIASEVATRIAGCIFVAHNARFDYGFLKHEFGRLGRAFTAKVLCTVKLSRRLLTDPARHNLDSLIEHPSRTVLVRVKGDSMIDAGVLDGDLVVVEKRAGARRGEIVVAIVDNQFTLKRLDLERGRFILRPENKAYPIIRPEGTLEIFGVMVGLVRKIA